MVKFKKKMSPTYNGLKSQLPPSSFQQSMYTYPQQKLKKDTWNDEQAT